MGTTQKERYIFLQNAGRIFTFLSLALHRLGTTICSPLNVISPHKASLEIPPLPAQL